MTFIHLYNPGKKGSKHSLLLLHGTGGDEKGLFPLGKKISPDSAMLGVRGKVSENGMNRYFRRLAEGVFDMEDLLFRTNELADFIDSAKKDYDLHDLYALGYSNGANIAASILLLRPKTLDGAILFRSMMPLAPKELPGLSGKRIFLSAGTHDALISGDKVEPLARLFSQCGAEVKMNWQQGGHELHPEEIAAAKRWLG